jgi:hypothetical protein
MPDRERQGSSRDRPALEGGERLRENVERSSGGAPKFHPQSFEEARSLLRPQLHALREVAAALPSALRGERIIFEATLLPNYLANSYFPTALFESADLVPIGTRVAHAMYRTRTIEREGAPTKAVVVSATEESLDRLASLLDAPAGAVGRTIQENLQEFSRFELPAAATKIHRFDERLVASGELKTFEAVLHPAVGATRSTTASEIEENFSKWVAFIERLEGQVIQTYRRTLDDLTFVPVRLKPERVEDAAVFNPLRAIRPMPQMRPIPSPILRSVPSASPPIAPPAGTPVRSDVRVAVFDGGIDRACSFLAPYVTAVDLTSETEDAACVAHGTAVTSAALFGHAAPGQQLETPSAHVDHFRVLPAPSAAWDMDLYWILDRIVETIERGQYDIVNLSLGPDLAIDDGDPHRWTAELDRLARERGVLFVTAVGNNGDADATLGLNRVQVPADAVNGLGIGACGERSNSSWDRAPYSAVGPGRPGGRIQPVGVLFGGSDQEPFLAMTGGGGWAEAMGTSLATPLGVNGLTGLAAFLGRDRAQPHTLRAFAAHFAEPLQPARPLEVGYGRIREDYADATQCESHEMTLVYEDQLGRDETVALPLPVPDGSLDGMNVSLRWTLAFTSPTDPTDAVDYTRAAIEIQFRPHARRFMFNLPGSGGTVGPFDMQEDSNDVAALLRAGAQPSIHPVTRSPGDARLLEAERREDGKWETMVQLTHNMRGSKLFRPRLDVSFLARDSGSLIRDAVPPLDFTLILTIRGRVGSDIYDRVRTEFSVLTPIRAEVPLRIRV